ncbi:hypothetical protein G7B40_017745 [Aetokthonos hydrillicola Thurmond2011]|jgi:hypothetical protein|uniref:Type II secretion system protein GspC N-terminal domain-containing protein n=1 Tax=Aetokthonos hydrillicola Thurmond2011 TaxID=2712845 RepID=A0AAP5MA48_9CYAN|nr:hypothetical protein [Aetokthonos hydrillicola]MBO3458206.1 hypothetical protein [Aetokthonos hydrillicola CCALA 1050]MBW4584426.1 hypothetical protein [Aetokthonos hydrillicola CCALA 1050]MDR9896387.1 hypothetical protein [Aetokthonos hydrillicola Thurmond2011]
MSQQASTNLTVLEPSEDLIASEPWSIESYADSFMDEIFADIDQILDSSGNQLPPIFQPKAHSRITTLQQIIHLGQESATPDWAVKLANSLGYRTEGFDKSDSTAMPSEYAPLQTVMMPQIVLQDSGLPQVQTVPQAKKKRASTVLVDNPSVSKVRKPRRKRSFLLVRLLSLGIPLGLLITGIIWLVNSGVLNRFISKSFPQSALNPQSQPELPTKEKLEADLVDYIMGSLAAIDRQEANTQKSGKTLIANVNSPNQTAFAYISNQPTGNLPTPLTANNTTPAPNRLVERLYIPVYQAPSPMRYAPPPILEALKPLPQPPSPQQIKQNTFPAPIKTPPKLAKPGAITALANIKPVAVQKSAVTIKQPPKPLPVLPSQVKQPKPSTPIDSEELSAKQQVVAVVSAPVTSHVLEGLLELGNKSAALFKIDGVTHRVEIGENIGSSGWALVEVAKGEAVIRRNGEVRSVYIGQKF